MNNSIGVSASSSSGFYRMRSLNVTGEIQEYRTISLSDLHSMTIPALSVTSYINVSDLRVLLAEALYGQCPSQAQ